MTTTCKDWCGDAWACLPRGVDVRFWGTDAKGMMCGYCSDECRDTGKPLHPVSKPPGEPTSLLPGQRCTWSTMAPAHGKHGHDFDRGVAIQWEQYGGFPGLERCPYVEPAPGSALPLPGPPLRAKARRLVHAIYRFQERCGHEDAIDDEHDDACNQLTGILFVEMDSAARDLAEARTALASRDAELEEYREVHDEVRKGWGFALDRAKAAEARLAVTVAALERATALLKQERDASMCLMVDIKLVGRKGGITKHVSLCPSIDPCWWCAVDAFLATDARAALAPTGAPVPSPAGTAVPATLAAGQDPWVLSRGVGTAVPEVCWVCNGKRKVPVDFPAMPCPACSPGGEP